MTAVIIVFAVLVGLVTSVDARTAKRLPSWVHWGGAICLGGSIVLAALAN